MASDGTKLILDTRTSVALDRAGIPKSDWYGGNQTGVPVPNPTSSPSLVGKTFDDLAAEQIKNNKLPPTGTPDMPKGEEMMEVGRCIEVLNPYDWLPGHGENSIELRTQKNDLSVIIPYDGEHGEQKELLFRHAVAFYQSAFPGPGLLNLQCSVHSNVSMSSLIECPDSEAAHAWAQHFRGLFDFKHYSITFLSENIALVVFATDFELREVD